MLGQK